MIGPALPGKPVLLLPAHDASTFDSGVPALDDYLRRHALQNNLNRSSRTFAALRDDRVIGYYTLAAAAVIRSDAPDRVTKGLGRYEIPVILIARLAVDRSEQGRGLGRGLLKDALSRIVQAAELIGCRAALVHAKDAGAKSFYEKFGFVPSPTNDLHLFLLMKDIIANMAEAAS